MKKILILWLLFFNIYPCIQQNGISFTTAQVCYSQKPTYSNYLEDNVSAWLEKVMRSQTASVADFFGWLDATYASSTAIGIRNTNNNNVYVPPVLDPCLNSNYTTSFGDPFALMPPKCKSWSISYPSAPAIPTEPVFYGGGGGGYSPNPAFVALAVQMEYPPDPDPQNTVYDCEGTPNGTAFMDDCGRCIGGFTGLIPCYIPPPDCAGVNGGSAFRDSCNVCVGGTTEKLPCLKDCTNLWGGTAAPDGCHACAGGLTGIPPCDTVSVIKVICDTLAILNNNKTTQIIDSLNKEPKMIALRNKVHNALEQSLAGYDSSGNYRVFKVTSTNATTFSTTVPIYDTTTGPSHKNIVTIVHTHNDYADPYPDNGDVYSLIEGRHLTNKNLFRSYIVSATAGTDLAIVVTDTMAALQFINFYPKDSAIHYDTRISINATGDTIIGLYNPSWADFKGNFGQDSISMKNEFLTATRKLRSNHYSEELLNTYAQVYMIKRYNIGIKILIKINGIFKELSPIISRDSTNGTLNNLLIKICN